MRNNKNIKTPPLSSPHHLWIYGKHAVFAALQNPLRECRQLLVTRNVYQELEGDKHVADYKKKVKFFITDPHFIEDLLPKSAVHQGIAMEISPLPEPDFDLFAINCQKKTHSCILILDQVTDPHNVGAILRSAAAFNIDAVIVTKHHSPQETGTLAKAASGGLEHVPLIKTTNLVATMDSLKKAGYWCIGLDGEASDGLPNKAAFPKIVLVLGAEGKGLRRLTREHCDLMVHLPTTGAIKSLNVSNAAAIALYAVHSSGS